MFALGLGVGFSPQTGGGALGTLGVNPPSITENSAPGAIVGAITGGKPGSTITITDTAGSRFAISGSNVVAGATNSDYETATSYDITLRETNASYPNSPNDTVITIQVADVNTALAALTLSASSIEENSAAGTVVGAVQNTSGGTVTITDAAGGRFALSGGNVVAGATATDYETATTHNITLTETLGESSNSPRNTVLAITITDQAVEGSTLNPADKDASVVLSNGNLTGSGSDTTGRSVRGTTSKSSGQWHFEFTVGSKTGVGPVIGLGRSTSALTNIPGQAATSVGVRGDGQVFESGVDTGINLGAIIVGSVIAVEVDFVSGTIFMQRNGGTREGVSNLNGTLFPMLGVVTGSSATLNPTGPFTITPTSGYSAWG